MSSPMGWGIAVVVMGGLLNGSFAAPTKRMSAWRWENTWLIFCLTGLVIIPWVFAGATVPHLGSVYQGSSWSTLLKVTLSGFGWGLGATLFGLGIDRVGMALGFAIILGITSSVGSLLPLAVLHSEQLLTRRGFALIAGTLVMVLGLVFLTIAGRRREREVAGVAQNAPRSGFALGLVICIFAGIFSAMLNFCFLFGDELKQRALAQGASVPMASNPIWSLAVSAGFLINAAYCAYLLNKNRTWHLFSLARAPAGCWFGGALMGLLWFGGIAVYGMGATSLGSLGGIIGWPVFMSMDIVTGFFWGAVTGEWKGASRRSFAFCWIGIGILLLAIYVVSKGSAA